MKTNYTTHYVGIDICKAKLDVHCRHWNSIGVFNNDARGIKSLLEKLIKNVSEHPVQLVCEATGGYEKKLTDAALNAGVPISLTNPRKVRDFARASGRLAKTDAIDAEVITCFAECFKPLPVEPKSPEQEALQLAVRRRDRLVRLRAAEKTTLQKTIDKFIRKDIESNIQYLDRRISRMEAHIESLIKNNRDFYAKSCRMQEIVGVGQVISSTILAELPELGRISDKQASSLVGLAPFNNDSGPRRGKRSVSGGRALIRRTLYTPVLCATQHNPVFKEFYQRLRAAGKPHHVAAVAVMRKLVCLLNRMLTDVDFVPIK